MKADVVIIGGGLSGLTCGITLAAAGKRVVMVKAGASTLHFFSGSIGLSHADHADLKELDHAGPDFEESLNSQLSTLNTKIKELFAGAGIAMEESAYRLTPMGLLKPSWLTMESCLNIKHPDELKNKKIMVAGISGFLDLPADMLAEGLKDLGAHVKRADVTTSVIAALRKSPSEMRATTLAHHLAQNPQNIWDLAGEINKVVGNCDMVLMPAVLRTEAYRQLAERVATPLRLVATLPPSLLGAEVEEKLMARFAALGGSCLMGDTALKADVTDGEVTALYTEKLADMPLRAEKYVLATGSFVSRGLCSDYDRIYEPIFGVDVKSDEGHDAWTQFGFFEPQAYMNYGVKVDAGYHALMQGQPMKNLYAIGSILAREQELPDSDTTGDALQSALSLISQLSTLNSQN